MGSRLTPLKAGEGFGSGTDYAASGHVNTANAERGRSTRSRLRRPNSRSTAMLGPMLFCHGSPRSDTEMLTSFTAPERLGPVMSGVAEHTIVYGHTHRQFDRQVADRRLVKAGAVGMPYRATRLPSGRYSALTSSYGRRTRHDIEAAVRTLRAAGPPDIDG